MADRKKRTTEVPVPARGNDSVFVLFKGGRLPSWHLLTEAERTDAVQRHINLMLSVAERHGLRRLDGFRLLGRQRDWERFWVIELPNLEAAEAWIVAEMAAPYGLYGYYEYHLARSWAVEHLKTWPTFPRARDPQRTTDPHIRPELGADMSSIVVLLFGRGRPGYEAATPEQRGDVGHVELMQRVAKDHRMIRIEAFQLMDPISDWHRAWVIEFPTLEGAEAWMENEVLPPHGAYSSKAFLLARRWSPEYFSTWVPRTSRKATGG